MAKKSAKKKPAEEALDFEEAMEQLQRIVHDLEEGEVGLDESLRQYERGVKLLRRCHDLLEGAQRRIELLGGVDAQGNPVATPFDDSADASLEEKARNRGRRRSQRTGSRKGTGTPSDLGDDENGIDVPGGLF